MEKKPVLELVARLCNTLEAEKIDYCHWKSNIALDRSASGENDLDLLINRADAQHFTEILYRLGFREARAKEDKRLPGVLDYYGYDQKADRLIHVHTHYQLVLGNDLSKNYRLPLERPYLASSVQGELFRVPAREFELVILVIRLVLKHATWDAFLMRHGGNSPSEKRELEDLAMPETLAKVDSVLAYLPFVERALFDECLQVLQPGSSLLKRIKVGERLQKALQSCARSPQMADILLKFSRRLGYSIQGRLFNWAFKRRMSDGGLLIAIVGGDGAGKSTAIDELYDWLAGKYETIKVHMGKPAWSWTTIAVRAFLKIGTVLRLYPFEKETEEVYSTSFPGYPSLIRSVCTARDRYLTYLKARRFSSNGGLVLCDRYSFPGFMTMDGPQCERTTKDARKNGFLNFLTNLEKSYYRQVLLPDLLIVLRVEPEIAVKRKTDETEVSVRARSSEVWKLDWAQTPAHVIDASRSKAEILAEIKALVWSHL